MKINVGVLVSYDYELIKVSLPTFYKHSDTITIAIDQNLRTWNGGNFTIAPSFFTWLEAFDTEKKVTIYRDDFYDPALNVTQNDTRERNMLAKQMGEGWNVQIDADEYFIDFEGFVHYLKNLRTTKPVQVMGLWVVMYKILEDGILCVKRPSPFPLATNAPSFKKCRNTRQMKIIAPYLVMHQSWARPIDELEHKLKNWSHANDFDVDKYIEFYKGLNKDNYKAARNVHPMNKKWWKQLMFVPGKNIPEVVENLRANLPKINMLWVWFKNLEQRVKFMRLF